MSKKMLIASYDSVISLESLLAAWMDFTRGKRMRADVLLYERDLMGNLLALHESLSALTYRHGPYEAFGVSDPKPRRIHKATVADRVVHRALHRVLCPFFDRTFAHDSYSCRSGKGTHRALYRFEALARSASCNHSQTAWVLKCDIRKFFASISHSVLLQLLEERIVDWRVMWLCKQVIHSFHSGAPGTGLPLGNLTSQLFANVYLNEFDQFVKHGLRVRYYCRYADDFVLLSTDRRQLSELVPVLENYLWDRLRLRLHHGKVTIQTVASGVDFLGWVHFSDHRVLRPSTKRRMFGAAARGLSDRATASYMGLLSHGNARRLQLRLKRERLS